MTTFLQQWNRKLQLDEYEVYVLIIYDKDGNIYEDARGRVDMPENKSYLPVADVKRIAKKKIQTEQDKQIKKEMAKGNNFYFVNSKSEIVLYLFLDGEKLSLVDKESKVQQWTYEYNLEKAQEIQSKYYFKASINADTTYFGTYQVTNYTELDTSDIVEQAGQLYEQVRHNVYIDKSTFFTLFNLFDVQKRDKALLDGEFKEKVEVKEVA